MLFEEKEKWDKTVPADLIPAVKHLRKSLEDVHWGCGQTTRVFCFGLLHGTKVDDPANEYINYLMHTKARVGAAATERFHRLLKEGTLPAIFKAFFDLYIDGVSIEAVRAFADLLEIGRANQKRLAMPYLEWAEAQTKHLIRSNKHLIRIWVRNVCDVHVYDPDDKSDELFFWRKWQAPLLTVMSPSRVLPYDSSRVWERDDPQSSSELLDRFTEDYVLRVESRIGQAAGAAALEAAKKQPADPDPPQPASAGSPVKEARPSRPAQSKIDLRKRETQARYKRWQKEYKELKKRRPNMSDVWYSQQIAGLDIAAGQSADTIRKNMNR